MEMLPEKVSQFIEIFDQAKVDIRAREGCLGLELLRSEENEYVSLWTISHWESEEALNAYRSSALFTKTWSAVKPLFSAKARAWTLTSIEKIV